MYEREDWTFFRTIETLSQKAGVPPGQLPKLVAKELVDNALDAAGSCRVFTLDPNGLMVDDDGEGIPGTDEEIAHLFSIRRPLASTKVLRKPSRGALGNGLRVVVGAVLASRGSITVGTRGRQLRLSPRDDGTTAVESRSPFSGTGTMICVQFTRVMMPLRFDTLEWADLAIKLAKGGRRYDGQTSPHWYDDDAFFELLQSARGRTIREVIKEFEGCSGKAGRIASEFKGRLAASLDRREAGRLLTLARQHAKIIEARHLGGVGKIDGLPVSYAKASGWMGTTPAIPTVIEAWAQRTTGEPGVRLCVNRTPAPVEMKAYHDKSDSTVIFHGVGGYRDHFHCGRHPYEVLINVETPYMPIVSDGKSPDLSKVSALIDEAVQKALDKAKRADAAPRGESATSQKGAILAVLEESRLKVSGDGRSRFGQRQLFYAVRDIIKRRGLPVKEPTWGYFCRVITRSRERSRHHRGPLSRRPGHALPPAHRGGNPRRHALRRGLPAAGLDVQQGALLREGRVLPDLEGRRVAGA
jgi:hypothetical protein